MSSTTSAAEVIEKLKAMSNPENIAGMARFGINSEGTLGISIPALRVIAKEIGKNHQLALALWDSRIHEARILTSFIDDPKQVSEAQMEVWVKDFDSWDVCDQCCSNLFDKTPYAFSKAQEWSAREEQFVKRAGFALMACLAVHDKKARDEQLEIFLSLILHGASDDRNFVKKAVNWALRQIGKRNLYLNSRAIEIAEKIKKLDSKSARWIANDALRELTSQSVLERLIKKAQ